MAFKAEHGDRTFNSKFRKSRYDQENSPTEPGPRARAHEVEGTKPSPESDKQEPGSEQQRARELHMTFDDEAGQHHVHAVNDDGTEEHTDHPSRDEALVHAGKKAIGAWPPGQREQPDAENVPDMDDYSAMPL